MAAGRTCEVSVVLTFADDEESIGYACKRLRSYLSEHGISFEIFAVDEGAGDNSQSVLALLKKELPELRVLSANGPGRGYSLAAAEARGRVLWLVKPRAVHSTLAPFLRAYRLVEAGERDLVQVDRHFLLLRRTRTLPLFDTPIRLGFRRLVRRAMRAGLSIETQGGAKRLRFTQVWRGFSLTWPPPISRTRG